MNNSRRKEIKSQIEVLENIKEMLSGVQSSIDEIKDDEECSLDNLPEGLQMSERGEAMEDNINDLDTAMSDIESITDEIEDIITNLQEIIER